MRQSGGDRTKTTDTAARGPGAASAGQRLALVVAWCRDEPERVGERLGDPAAAPRAAWIFGRSEPGAPRIGSVRQRPGHNEAATPWTSPRLSRDQLAITDEGDQLAITNLGRRELLHKGSAVERVRLGRGEVVELRGQLLLRVERRPTVFPAAALPLHPFGEADAQGLVGESLAAWELRRRLAFLARRRGHVLILGPSGSGKELAARALHRGGPFVARNAATLPEGLVDAELFGNVRNYPNPGMAERPGLIGAADGGTLFLDEFAELPPSAQAHLLRVLDQGEYQRLGEAKPSRSRFRLIAATNRPLYDIQHDVAARFVFQQHTPALSERREDIPLLLRHLLGQIAADDAEVAQRFVRDGAPRVSAEFIATLLAHPLRGNVRELCALLWASITDSPGDALETPAPARLGSQAEAPPTPGPINLDDWVGQPAETIPADVLQACLDAHNGQVAQAAARLGMSSRFVLSRQIRRHGLVRRLRGGLPEAD